MPEAELKEANAKLEELVASGFKLFNEGKSREAMMVAETAVLTNPSSTGALSLKGMCHEHLGEIAEALECYEHVVKLNPDSALDRIKVNDLRNLLAARIQPAPAADRRPLVAAGIAAALLVVTVGALAARGLGNKPAPNTNYVASNQPAKNEPVASAFGNQATTPPAETDKPAVQPAATPTDPDIHPTQPPGGDGSPVLQKPTGPTLPNIGDEVPPWGKGAISVTGIGGNNRDTEKPPVTSNGSTKPNGPGTVIDPEDPEKTSFPPEVNKPKDNPGMIEINVSTPANGRRLNGGNDSGSSANGAEATLRAAVNNFESKRYPEAARGFERAIGDGQNTARNYQRLGDCYRYMGKTDDAVNAYSHAADIHKQNNNPTGEAVCRQQIKVLRGG